MWFSINLATTADGKPTITNGPDMDCVADIVREIRELGMHTVHLISIGGWNSPHPDTTISAEEGYEYWNYWNRHIAARPEKGFLGFDGFDWDIEGMLWCTVPVVMRCFMCSTACRERRPELAVQHLHGGVPGLHGQILATGQGARQLRRFDGPGR